MSKRLVYQIACIFSIFLLLKSCNNAAKQPSDDSITIEESVEIEAEEEAIEDVEPAVHERLSLLLQKHKFDEASELIQREGFKVDELFETNRGLKWLVGSTLLIKSIFDCDLESIVYLLENDADPSLKSLTYGYDEWDIGTISASITLADLSGGGHDGFVIKESPLAKSLSCDDSTVFYTLIKYGSDDKTAKIQGAIKWEDTLLMKQSLVDSVAIDFVPSTAQRDLLELLVPVTDGTQYSEIDYGEGGDMFDSDLMNACAENNQSLVWFMLEVGADPNHCLPKNYVDGEFVGPDSAGYYPASTPLSIATENYETNLNTHNSRTDDSLYLAQANASKAIIEMLEAAGAEEISRCLGP